jgi:hypothetical protein
LRGIAARLVPIVVVASATAVFVVFLAILEVALGVVVVSHVVVLVLLEVVVLELLDQVVIRVLLLGRFVVGLVLGVFVVVELGELVAGGLCVDLECLLARIGVLALALGINYVPELFREVFLL